MFPVPPPPRLHPQGVGRATPPPHDFPIEPWISLQPKGLLTRKRPLVSRNPAPSLGVGLLAGLSWIPPKVGLFFDEKCFSFPFVRPLYLTPRTLPHLPPSGCPKNPGEGPFGRSRWMGGGFTDPPLPLVSGGQNFRPLGQDQTNFFGTLCETYIFVGNGPQSPRFDVISFFSRILVDCFFCILRLMLIAKCIFFHSKKFV